MNPLARFSLLVFALLVAGMSLALNIAIADELPEDTDKIESLTPEQARKLAEEFPGVNVKLENKGFFRGDAERCLPLNGLKSVDAELAEALAGYAKGPLLLDGLTMLSDEAAKALAQHKGGLYLNGLTTLSQEVARALTPHMGELNLDGLTMLSGEAAEALAQHKGLMKLNGLTTLSDEAAKTLVQHVGRLSLYGLTTLSGEAAKALAASEKWDGQLQELTALDSRDSVAIAQALATRKGPLRLPNLKKISPKTLTALIEKKDVVIPPIESLELILEPDGSVTEDFILPD